MKRTIREFGIEDIDLVVCYFINADHAFLDKLGIDLKKLPVHSKWRQILLDDFKRPIEQKKFYYVVWELDGLPVGHSNINKIVFGKEAYMHLHLWKSIDRKSGHGTFFIGESIRRYFDLFQLKYLICEPSALNPAPNKTLAKLGFEHIKTYETVPGWINYHQTVNRWVLSHNKLTND